MHLPSGPGSAVPLAAADIASFPEPARRYLAFMGVLEPQAGPGGAASARGVLTGTARIEQAVTVDGVSA